MDYLPSFMTGQSSNAMPNLNAALSAGGASASFMSSYGTYILIAGFILALVVGSYVYINYVKSENAEVYSINQEDNNRKTQKEAELLLFYVDWCPHCKTAKPEWEELKAEYQHSTINGYKVIFTEVNCTEETPEVENMINKYKIEGYPTVKLLKDGQIIEYDAKPTKATMSEFLNTVL